MDRLAIIGLEACFGAAPDLEAFARAVYAGASLETPCTLSLPEPDRLLRVGNNALLAAGVTRGSRTALLLSVPDAATIAARLTELWNFTGPVLTRPAGALAALLGEAQPLLAARRAEAALLLIFEPNGVGALVLAPAETVPPAGCEALLESWSTGAAAETAGRQALHAAGLEIPAIGLLEAPRPFPDELLEAYRLPAVPEDLTCALSEGAGSPTAGLIKAALCLKRRFIPALTGWQGPAAPERWQRTPFYVAPEPRGWFAEPQIVRRRAALHWADSTGHTHLILAEPGPQRAEPPVRPQPGAETVYLFPLTADQPDGLLSRLAALQETLLPQTDLATLAAETFAAYRAAAPCAVALVAQNEAELRREIGLALEGLPKAIAAGTPWTTPRGSAFTPHPLGGDGVAFVYPGAFNSYLNLGRELFQHFPDLHERLAGVISNVDCAVGARMIYPRRLDPLDEAERQARAAALAADPTVLIESGTTFALAFTRVVRDIFGVQPRASLGYSLGEVSMLWAAGIWNTGDAGSEAWLNSPLFKRRLCGPKEAVREAWGRPNGPDDFWRTWLLKAPVEKVRAALVNEPHVFLTIINLPDEVVIAGEEAGCRRVIAALDCHSLRVPTDSVIHNPAMRSEYGAFVELYRHPIHTVPAAAFYSAAHYAPLPLESDALAHAIAEMTCNPLDFPRLVEAAYIGGARLFIELGPQGTCTRWIGRILRGRPHAAVAINRPGVGDYEGILAALALLVSHRVPLNLAPLYANPEAIERARVQPAAPLSPPHLPDPTPYIETLTRHAARLAEGHQAFLQTRQTALEQTAALIGMQTELAAHLWGAPAPAPRPKPALYPEAAIREFASGDPTACFGAAYEVYRGRRTPRLPNGDLLLISRITAVEGTQNRVAPGSAVTAEYDIPADAWFYREQTDLPYSLLMEAALQPSGFLAAFMGSTLPYPEVDFYFRNLDGTGRLAHRVDLRGHTLTNRTRLLSSTMAQDIIIQKYAFELACEGTPFYQGEASFGYFTAAALHNQVGLDGGPARPPQYRAAPGPHWIPAHPRTRSRLDLLDRIWLTDGGMIYAEVPLAPADWFFHCHFYQDPVMPGSLGVEAMRQALEHYAHHLGAAGPCRLSAPGTTTWKYRGQVTPETGRIALEVAVTGVDRRPEGLTLTGDASLWKGDLRIYEVKQLKVTHETALSSP